jgi:hypothetical protein
MNRRDGTLKVSEGKTWVGLMALMVVTESAEWRGNKNIGIHLTELTQVIKIYSFFSSPRYKITRDV